MQFDKDRKKPSPFARGVCPMCDGIVIAKCGELKMWHWAHLQTTPHCTSEHEETPWHRMWKDQFTECAQEIVREVNGKRHRADVIFDGVVYEFQSKSLRPEEMLERERFWCELGYDFVWIIRAPGAELRARPYCKEPAPWKAYTWMNPWGGFRDTVCPVIIDRCDDWLVVCSYIEWDNKTLLTRAEVRAMWRKGEGSLIDFREEAHLCSEQYRSVKNVWHHTVDVTGNIA